MDVRAVQAALGVASRLGFASRVTPLVAADLTTSPSLSGTRGECMMGLHAVLGAFY